MPDVEEWHNIPTCLVHFYFVSMVTALVFVLVHHPCYSLGTSSVLLWKVLLMNSLHELYYKHNCMLFTVELCCLLFICQLLTVHLLIHRLTLYLCLFVLYLLAW